MNWTDFGTALALMLVFEGLIPFLSPSAWRQVVLSALTMNDRRLRRWGLMMMLLGAGLLSVIKGQ